VPFSKLGLSPKVIDGVRAAGYAEPTAIQLRAIPLILEGRDVIGSAQTGTGKTAAFALPMISRLGQRGGLRALAQEPALERRRRLRDVMTWEVRAAVDADLVAALEVLVSTRRAEHDRTVSNRTVSSPVRYSTVHVSPP